MEKIFKNISLLSASIVLVILISIFITLFISSKDAISEFGFGFVSNPAWQEEVPLTKEEMQKHKVADEYSLFPDEEPTKTVYGGLIPIVGTLLSTFIAIAFALPIAMGIAVFLAEIAPKNISNVVGIAIELLAAIPSIIFGMWGLFYFAPIIQDFVGGYQVSLLTAGLVLGVMILPFMAAITRDSMKTTPDILKESAYALGATKFEVIKDVIFPYSKVGIIGSIILALGRALGETMAVAFLIGSVFELPKALNSPTISIPVALANNFGEATGLGASSLFYLAFMLFIISFIVISIAKFYFLKRVKK
ncbi:phosphate ABC transporter permease subunit PstC [Halarcobacter ebronensis]|uniref:Phosphate transport system permease protein n=1 Tax=Halarcobacter ebronensis TaxID=1462615 RepID=A0A4Q0YFS7_9BACT|nr:phosphate ABC transporter permease subunit PstC [Halarcobacter ebronensis]RXJ68534.1 phosphate ABC transporter permease subunit PstC [Halarcobacter ebronensis]